MHDCSLDQAFDLGDELVLRPYELTETLDLVVDGLIHLHTRQVMEGEAVSVEDLSLRYTTDLVQLDVNLCRDLLVNEDLEHV